LFDLSEEIPLIGQSYATNPTWTVSGGFLQFVSSLESAPPGQHATQSVRTARALAISKLRDLDNLRAQNKSGSLEPKQGNFSQLLLATKNASKAVKNYARLLGGSPRAAEIGAIIFAYFNPAEQMFVTRAGLAERVPKVGTSPALPQFMKRPFAGIAIPAKPLSVTFRCTGKADQAETLDVHFGATSASVLWFSRGKWFSKDALDKYRSGYWNSEAPPSPEAYFFGAKGRLQLVPMGVLVIRDPFVLVDTSQDMEKRLRDGSCMLGMAVASTTEWKISKEDVPASIDGKLTPAQGVKFELAAPSVAWIAAVLSERP